jgi:uncharacterized protein YbjT (DUF2867 family)
MSEKKIIAVIGSTGAQGGGLARAIAADRSGEFAGRAITRHPESEKGRALASLGLEVVGADMDDEASLGRAFEGADGVFAVTNFWEHLSPEKELTQAGAIARAAKGAGVGHVVWSTLEDTRKRVPLSDSRLPTLHEKYKVPHFDAKGEADRLFSEQGLPMTYLLAAFYWDNFIHFGMGPRKSPDGGTVLALPLGGGRLPGIAAGDIGRCAYGIFRRGQEMIGKRVGIAGEILSGTEMAERFSRALGTTVNFYDMPFDDYRALGFPGADDLGNMFQYQAIFNDDFCDSRDIALSRALNPELQTFSAWLERNKGAISIA